MFPVSFLALVLLKINKKKIFSSNTLWVIFFLLLFKIDYTFYLVLNDNYYNSAFNSIIILSIFILALNIIIYFLKSSLLISLNKGLMQAMVLNSVQSILFNLKPLNLFYPIVDKDLNFSLIGYYFNYETPPSLNFAYFFIELILIVFYKNIVKDKLILLKPEAYVIRNFMLIDKIFIIINFFILIGFSIMYFYSSDLLQDMFFLSSISIITALIIAVYMTFTLNKHKE